LSLTAAGADYENPGLPPMADSACPLSYFEEVIVCDFNFNLT